MSADESSDWGDSSEEETKPKSKKGGGSGAPPAKSAAKKKRKSAFNDDSSEDEESPPPVKVQKKKAAPKSGGRRRKGRAAKKSQSNSPSPPPPSAGDSGSVSEVKEEPSEELATGSQRPLWNDSDFRSRIEGMITAEIQRDRDSYQKCQVFESFTDRESEEKKSTDECTRKFPVRLSEEEKFGECLNRYFGSDEVKVAELDSAQLRDLCLGALWTAAPTFENIGEDKHRPFLVDFDSVLMDILAASDQCAQSASVIFALEERLASLCGGGRSVNLVVFRSGRSLFSSAADLMIREVCLYHVIYQWQYAVCMREERSGPLVFVFDHCWDVRFSRFCNEYMPVFALVCTDLASQGQRINPEAYHLALLLPLYLTALSVPCVQSTDVTFEGNGMFGFSLSFPRDTSATLEGLLLSPRKLGEAPTPIALDSSAIQEGWTLREACENGDHWSMDEDLFGNLCGSPLTDHGNNMRVLFTLHALCKVSAAKKSSSNPCLLDFIRSVLAQLVLLDGWSLPDRCQSLAGSMPDDHSLSFTPEFGELFDLFCSEIAWLLRSEQTDQDKGPLVRGGKISGEMNERDFAFELGEIYEGRLDRNQAMQKNRYTVYSGISSVDLFDSALLSQLLFFSAAMGGGEGSRGADAFAKQLCEDGNVQGMLDIIAEHAGFAEGTPVWPIVTDESLKQSLLDRQSGFSCKIPGSEMIGSVKDFGLVPMAIGPTESLLTEADSLLNKRGLISTNTRAKELKRKQQQCVEWLEKKRWLPGKVVSDQIVETVEDTRQSQLMIRFLEKYAASLEGGKLVLRDVTVSKKRPSSASDSGSSSPAKKKGRRGGSSKKGKNDMREQLERELQEKARTEALAKIDNLISLCETQVPDLESRISRLDDQLSSMDDPITALPGLTKLHEWCHEAAVRSRFERNSYPCVRLWQVVFDIFRRFVESVDDTNEDSLVAAVLPEVTLIKRLQQSLYVFGFEEPAKGICRVYVDKVNAQRRAASKKGGRGGGGKKKKIPPLLFDEVFVPFRREYVRQAVGASYARFQMHYCGPYMIRGMGSVKDERVEGFYPDAWQVKLLDICDRRQSCLVVAPTSSGKTYVSYYCMKKVLSDNERCKKEADKGVVVYVAPTRALVYQALADLYSKYAAKFGDVFGTYVTKNPPRKVLHSQVLICEPETLQELLTSPERSFIATRIKYVIFDEIHCLGRSVGGETWERLLMLIRAPFFALSATVGGADKFLGWLRKVENTQRDDTDKFVNRVHLVCFNERWSDLEKHVYLPNKQLFGSTQELIDSGNCVGGLDEGFKSACIQLHPGAALALGSSGLESIDEFPPGLHLSPNDSMLLFNAMNKVVSELPPVFSARLSALRPDLYLNQIYITKSVANEFAKRLTDEIRLWLNSVDASDADVSVFTQRGEMIAGMDYGMPPEDEDIRQGWVISQGSRKGAAKSSRSKGKSGKGGGGSGTSEDTKGAEEGSVGSKKKKKKKGTDDDSGELGSREVMNEHTKKERRQLVGEVMNRLAEYPTQRMAELSELAADKGCPAQGFDFVLNNMTQLLLDLDTFDKMPVLVFCLDRARCEELYVRVVNDLEAMEDKVNQQRLEAAGISADTEEARKTKADTKRLAALKKELERLERNDKKEKGDSSRPNPLIEQAEQQIAELEASLSGVTETDYRFTFQKKGFEMDSEEKKWWTGRVRGATDKSPLMRGLARGIGIHHNGLAFTYRTMTETLFRYRDMKVVIAQASLAMGVNMPARTVVFAGDDPTLTPLNYRQMMGRAGRRGYDNVGNVIFFGIPARKVAYLMTSQLTSLHGHYPLTSTSPLRALSMHAGYVADSAADWSLSSFGNLFHSPFGRPSGGLLSKDDHFEKQIALWFRCHLDFSAQLALVDPFVAGRGGSKRDDKITPLVGLSGLVNHLHPFEPSNIAMCRLVQSGLLHDLCQGYRSFGADPQSLGKRLRQSLLMFVFCHISVRVPLPYGFDTDSLRMDTSDIPLSEAAFIELPPLSEARTVFGTMFKSSEDIPKLCRVMDQVDRELRALNLQTAGLFSHYSRLISEAMMLEDEHSETLVQSEIQVKSKGGFPLPEWMKHKRIDVKSRSLLSAMQGKGDAFLNRWDLAESLRSGLLSESSVIPLAECVDLRGRTQRLNAFIFDLYRHNDYDRLLVENHMYDKLAYDRLSHFSDFLKRFKEVLAEVSNVAFEAEMDRDAVHRKEKEFRQTWELMRQQPRKHGIIFRGNHYKNWTTREVIDQREFEARLEKLKSKAYGDDLVQCFEDLHNDFVAKFKAITPPGPISRDSV